MKCWIASILSHKALVNAETSHLQPICFMVAVTMESTGLLLRSSGLSWRVYLPFKIKNLIDCESLSKTEKWWEKTVSCLFFQLKWKSFSAALGICAKIPDRGEDQLSSHGLLRFF